MFNKKSIAAAVAVSAVLFNTFATSAYAANTLVISGNGADSDNAVNLSQNQSNTVVQSNTADISNFIKTEGNTGGNVANNNTGGDVLIATGNSTQEVDVRNQANVNKASINDCACLSGATEVKLLGNGAGSDNAANVASNSTNTLFQDNYADFHNKVIVHGNTGDNVANNNTGSPYGGSDVVILTGNAVSDVDVRNAANKNWATIGGSAAPGLNGGTSLVISGNGADSQNSINLSKNRTNSVVQENDADFTNFVVQHLNSGYNRASNNTGGDVAIDTGAAFAKTLIDNRANFNFASLDCGCVTGGVSGLVSGNGADSDSALNAALNSTNDVFQGGQGAGNDADFWNGVFGDQDSGYNKASNNTGSVLGSDPSVFTGNSGSNTAVGNQANVNVYGSGLSLGGFDLAFGWDWSALW
jgi:hypothetical protein